SSVPQPDKNPLDCNGHGSHTAGTLAGSGVTSGGTTYGGPYNGSISTNPSDWKVFPGVAPQADIYAYRVFGCAGSSSIVDLAINQAVADGMNVISMSLGSDLGGTDDPTSVASQNAVDDGVSVVASAGNAGGSGYMVGSPSTSSGVLSVAAMDGTTPTFPGGHFALSTGTSLDAINANGATFSNGLNLPVVVVHDASQPGGVSLGCSVAAFTAANVTGKLAVVQLGGAPVAERDANAKKQGAKLTAGQKAAIRQQLRAQQDALHGKLANAGAKIVGQMQDAYNGIQVVVPQKNLAKLASLPGVTGIHAVAKFKPANINGVPFIGAPTAWQNTGATGSGVKVASLDTGIDYTHADFGGPGTSAAWDYAFAHSTVDPATDPTLAAEFGPTAPRVKGGTDFVGDDYNANDPSSVPQPDKNPLDCNGHGSH
ncbi:MAG TPA: S8 family serine peptidase, partial [Mycobacteriales bacterium]|nr:S8 family serine peptidase [Mycobacteriales bacterium]